MDNIAYVDFDDGIARVRGNKTLYKRMLGMFLASTEFKALDDALAAGDWAKAADAAHAIKGITGNLSLTALFQQSTALMGILRQGAPAEADISAYRSALEETIRQVEALMPTL